MISHKHKCLFIHVPKSGGMSVESVFLEELGLKHTDLKHADDHGLLLIPNLTNSEAPVWLAHLTFQQYVDLGYLSVECIEEYFSFATIRNPYDRVASAYRYLGFSCAVSFETFVMKELPKQLCPGMEFYYFLRPQFDFVCDDAGNIAVDQLIDMKDLNKEFPAIARRLGLQGEIKHVNRFAKPSWLRVQWRRLKFFVKGIYEMRFRINPEVEWDEILRKKIASLYSIDFEQLKYTK